MDVTAAFAAERDRLVHLASRILADPHEAEDVVQQAWLRLDRSGAVVDNLPAWLTTVTTRLCVDRLRARVPEPRDHTSPLAMPAPLSDAAVDPGETTELLSDVAAALHRVLDELTPHERVAMVLHDSFGFEFAVIAEALQISPTAARKLASRARAKVAREPGAEDDGVRAAERRGRPDWEVVDAFLDAARGGRFDRLLAILAPDAVVSADAAAAATGTPTRIEGRRPIAEFFNGAARAALPVMVDDRPAAAWYDRGTPRVVFDFVVAEGRVTAITFRADPRALARVVRRDGAIARG